MQTSTFGSPNMNGVRGTGYARTRTSSPMSADNQNRTTLANSMLRSRQQGQPNPVPVGMQIGGNAGYQPISGNTPNWSANNGAQGPPALGYGQIPTGFQYTADGRGYEPIGGMPGSVNSRGTLPQFPDPSGGLPTANSGFWSGNPNTVNTGIPGQNTMGGASAGANPAGLGQPNPNLPGGTPSMGGLGPNGGATANGFEAAATLPPPWQSGIWAGGTQLPQWTPEGYPILNFGGSTSSAPMYYLPPGANPEEALRLLPSDAPRATANAPVMLNDGRQDFQAGAANIGYSALDANGQGVGPGYDTNSVGPNNPPPPQWNAGGWSLPGQPTGPGVGGDTTAGTGSGPKSQSPGQIPGGIISNDLQAWLSQNPGRNIQDYWAQFQNPQNQSPTQPSPYAMYGL